MKNGEKGSGSLEIIIAILFLAIAAPAIVQLFYSTVIGSARLELENRAIFVCEEKMEQIMADKISPSRGYTYITTPSRYPAENIAGGFTRTTTVTPNQVLNGVTYAIVQVTVTHSAATTVSLTTWVTRF